MTGFCPIRATTTGRPSMPKAPKESYSAKFHIFLEVNKLLELFIPKDYQYTAEQADAIHAFARKLAADMASGIYH
jgi:hypothetical protein